MKSAILDGEHFQSLFDMVVEMGFLTYGPTVKNDVIVYDQIRGVDDLPVGYIDQQRPGSYRLIKKGPRSFFGYVIGPHTLRKYFHPSTEMICEAKRNPDEPPATKAKQQESGHTKGDLGPFSVTGLDRQVTKRALIGIRPCELQALVVCDTVFTQGPHVDSVYQQDRRNTFIVSVNCTNPGGTCFCTSMNTGPKASAGFDLSLTELTTSERHRFLIEAGSGEGAELLSKLTVTEPTSADIEESREVLQQAAARISKSLDTSDIKEILYGASDDQRWEETGSRCLSCGNCTMVCPTCFCTTVEDRTDISGSRAERLSKWDSCYTLDHSYIHGGSIRTSSAARYRQWMMHKLAYWHDQFGMSGCVGCGRCITWCPAGIDITEEAAALREGS